MMKERALAGDEISIPADGAGSKYLGEEGESYFRRQSSAGILGAEFNRSVFAPYDPSRRPNRVRLWWRVPAAHLASTIEGRCRRQSGGKSPGGPTRDRDPCHPRRARAG